MAAPTYFPLRWESTGDQWWFASPIDWAAANGHYDVVRELLHLDTNLLIKLTSLPRIRRLETLWDDDEKFNDVAKNRAHVAQKLFLESETESKKKGKNSLIRAGYGGWLLYTAAAAGDLGFVKELLDRDPLMVFGEGEYGATDILYAASRSKNCDVFRLVFDHCVSPRGHVKEASLGFRSEMRNRAVHAAARGGDLEMLRELLGNGGGGGGDVLAFRDARGSTLLHTASARGQLEVVKHLVSSYEMMITSVDNGGNTALNVAAYRGHLFVVEALISASPSLPSLTNNYGDTFLHMAVSGFLTPGFRRLDRHLDLMKHLAGPRLTNIQEIVNVKNSQGQTALHMAVIHNIPSNVVDLLMSLPSIDLNIRDADGNTLLDLLKQRPRSASSEILIKRLISAGGISNQTARNALVSHLRRHGIDGSPGTSFRVPDSQILLYTGVEHLGTPSASDYSGEIEDCELLKSSSKYSKLASFKNLLSFPLKKSRKGDSALEDECWSGKNSVTPLRQQFSRASSALPNNKRIQNLRNYPPSPSTKKKFAAGLTQGVLQVLPKTYFGSPSSAYSGSSWSSPISKGDSAAQSPNLDSVKTKGKNVSLMNSYLCFGAQGGVVDKSINSPEHSLNHQSLVA